MKRVLAAMVMMSAACTVNAQDDSAASPQTKALFAELPAATPDKLRGVWSLKSQGNAGDAEIRLRFTDGKIVGGVRCTTKAGAELLTVGGEVPATTDDLDKKSGSFTMKTTLQMDGKGSDGQTCQGRLDAAEWGFVVTGTNVILSSIEPKGTASFQKVGD